MSGRVACMGRGSAWWRLRGRSQGAHVLARGLEASRASRKTETPGRRATETARPSQGIWKQLPLEDTLPCLPPSSSPGREFFLCTRTCLPTGAPPSATSAALSPLRPTLDSALGRQAHVGAACLMSEACTCGRGAMFNLCLRRSRIRSRHPSQPSRRVDKTLEALEPEAMPVALHAVVVLGGAGEPLVACPAQLGALFGGGGRAEDQRWGPARLSVAAPMLRFGQWAVRPSDGGGGVRTEASKG